MNREIELAVVIPCYNASKFLKSTIESILSQTYRNFILVLINDGSKDNTEEIMYGFHDERIIHISFTKNQGLIKILNFAFEILKTKYIARMDADDIAHRKRFKVQMRYFSRHKNNILIGSEAMYFKDENVIKKVFFHKNIDINSRMLISCPIVHPTVIFDLEKINYLNIRYSSEFKSIEDYSLWIDLINYKKTNLKYKTMKYFIHEGSESSSLNNNTSEKINKLNLIYNKLFNKLNINFNEDEILLYNMFVNKRFESINSLNTLLEMVRVINETIRTNINFNHKIYNYFILDIMVDYFIEKDLKCKLLKHEIISNFGYKKFIYFSIKLLSKRIIAWIH